MTALFSTDSRLEAWLAAIDYLMGAGPDLNVILAISSPASDPSKDRAAAQSINRFYASEAQDPVHTVAESIFPAWEYRHRGIQGLYDTYSAEYEILKKGEPHRWGTYAYRLIHRRTASGAFVNPLAVLIDKMRSERHQEHRGTYRSCYELGVSEGEYDIPLYNSVDDQARRRGLPCLSHLSFKLYENNVHLTAVYRSHDYRYKVFGNLLGLARLQACVAHEVGVGLGSLVVHSTYAYIDLSKGKRRVEQLVTELRSMIT